MAGDTTIVLYVEDEENDQFFMRIAFQRQGIEPALRMVSNGQAAIHYLSGAGAYADRSQHPPPALVLLDLNLPEVSGFEVLQWIRAHPDHQDLPVIVLSSSPREDDQARVKALGANEFWQKPRSGLLFGHLIQGLREKWL
jgi:CheY-like chemotaxis protein